MLVMGNSMGPPIEGHTGTGQCALLCRSATLQVAILSGDSRASPVPRWGGIYVPDVLIFSGTDGRNITPFRMSMVYATAPWSPNLEEDPGLIQFQTEMREKISNVLRICHRNGHGELILGAWSCGRGNGPPQIVARIFRELLRGGADTFGVFKHVIFAVPSYSGAFDAFSKEFVVVHG